MSALSIVGSIVTVSTMSAMIRTSSPRRMACPIWRRALRVDPDPITAQPRREGDHQGAQRADHEDDDPGDLEGLDDGLHPLLERHLYMPPCPLAAAIPADRLANSGRG